MRVVLIGNQKFGDNGPMDDMAAAGERAAVELGVEFKKIESSPASFEEDIRSMSQEGYDLVITTFGYMSDATKLVAQEFPDTKYAAIFQEINTPEEPVANLWDAVFRGQTTFYVDGYIAGLATKTNRVGFIVGGEEPGPNAEGNGFMRGVRDANPDAVVEFAYASYEDSAKAKEVALAMIDKGCDVIQGDCAAPDAGIIEAVNETGKDVFVMSCIMDYTDASKNFVGTDQDELRHRRLRRDSGGRRRELPRRAAGHPRHHQRRLLPLLGGVRLLPRAYRQRGIRRGFQGRHRQGQGDRGEDQGGRACGRVRPHRARLEPHRG